MSALRAAIPKAMNANARKARKENGTCSLGVCERRRVRYRCRVKILEARTTIVGTPWRELLFLELIADDGRVGVSECRMVNKTATLEACINELAPRYVIGSDPFDVERLAWNVQRAEYGRPGEVTQSALASFEITQVSAAPSSTTEVVL